MGLYCHKELICFSSYVSLGIFRVIVLTWYIHKETQCWSLSAFTKISNKRWTELLLGPENVTIQTDVVPLLAGQWLDFRCMFLINLVVLFVQRN